MTAPSGDVVRKGPVEKGHGEHVSLKKEKSEWRGKSVYIKTSGEKGDGKTSFRSADSKPSFIKNIFQNKAERKTERQAEKLAELKARAQDLKISLLTQKELRSFGKEGRGADALSVANQLYETYLGLGKLDESLEKEGKLLREELDRIFDRLNSPFLYKINEIKNLLVEAKTEKNLSHLEKELNTLKERLKDEYKRTENRIPPAEIERMKKSVNGTIRSIEKTIIRKKAELNHDIKDLSSGFELLIKKLEEAASFKQINNVRLGLSELTVKLGKLESKGVDVKTVKAKLENVLNSINEQERRIRHHADNPEEGYRRTVLKEHESVRIPNKTSEGEGIGMLNLDENAGLTELRNTIREKLQGIFSFFRNLGGDDQGGWELPDVTDESVTPKAAENRAKTTDNLDNSSKPSTPRRARSKSEATGQGAIVGESVSVPRLGGRVPPGGAKPRKNADAVDLADDLENPAGARNDLEADLKNAARARNDSTAKAAAAEKAKVELAHRKEGLSLALSRMVNHANTVHKRNNNADLLDFKWAADMAKAGDQGALIAVEDWLIGRGYAKKDKRGDVSINQSIWEAEGFEKTYKTAVRAYNAINRLEGKNQEEKRVVYPNVVDPTAQRSDVQVDQASRKAESEARKAAASKLKALFSQLSKAITSEKMGGAFLPNLLPEAKEKAGKSDSAVMFLRAIETKKDMLKWETQQLLIKAWATYETAYDVKKRTAS